MTTFSRLEVASSCAYGDCELSRIACVAQLEIREVSCWKIRSRRRHDTKVVIVLLRKGLQEHYVLKASTLPTLQCAMYSVDCENTRRYCSACERSWGSCGAEITIASDPSTIQ